MFGSFGIFFDVILVIFLLAISFTVGYCIGTMAVLDRIHYITDKELSVKKET